MWSVKLLGLLLIVIIFCGSNAQDTSELIFVEYEVTSDTANVRSGAGTNFSVVGRLVRGDIVRGSSQKSISGWYAIVLEDGTEGFIADFLVRLAPQRLYPLDQEAILILEGRGPGLSEILDLPKGLYRLDYMVTGDGDISIRSEEVSGTCIGIEDQSNWGRNSISGSIEIRSRGCETIITVNDTTGEWKLEVRPAYIADLENNPALVEITDEYTLSNVGQQVTPATRLSKGTWAVEITAQSDSVWVWTRPYETRCLEDVIIVAGEIFVEPTSAKAVYQVDSTCTLMWRMMMLDEDDTWTLTIRKLR